MSFGTILSALILSFVKAPIFSAICFLYIPVAILIMRCSGAAANNAIFNKGEAYSELSKFT
jgi:hypothetical protein